MGKQAKKRNNRNGKRITDKERKWRWEGLKRKGMNGRLQDRTAEQMSAFQPSAQQGASPQLVQRLLLGLLGNYQAFCPSPPPIQTSGDEGDGVAAFTTSSVCDCIRQNSLTTVVQRERWLM